MSFTSSCSLFAWHRWTCAAYIPPNLQTPFTKPLKTRARAAGSCPTQESRFCCTIRYQRAFTHPLRNSLLRDILTISTLSQHAGESCKMTLCVSPQRAHLRAVSGLQVEMRGSVWQYTWPNNTMTVYENIGITPSAALTTKNLNTLVPVTARRAGAKPAASLYAGFASWK